MKTNNPKKLLAVTAAVIMLLPSCIHRGTGSETGESGGTVFSTVGETVSLPDANLDGLEFRILNNREHTDGNHENHGEPGYCIFDFAPDESAADAVSVALRKRNAAVTARYNVKLSVDKFTYWNYGDYIGVVDSGDTKYSLVSVPMSDAFQAATEGKCILADRLPNLQTDKPWYAHAVNEQFNIYGRQLLAYSAESLNLFETAACLLYSKTRIADVDGLVDPYDLVKDGTWTFDRMLEQARTAVKKLTDDVWINDLDMLGIVTGNTFYNNYAAMWTGAGYHTINFNSDGDPTIDSAWGKPNNFIYFLSKIHDAVKEQGTVFDVRKSTLVNDYDDDVIGGSMIIKGIFGSNHALYCILQVKDVKGYTGGEGGYGIVPMPKRDENQEQYRSLTYDSYIKIVPYSVTDVDNVSLVMEALAYESYKLIYEPYYGLMTHWRDEADARKTTEMLNLIRETMDTDLILTACGAVADGIADNASDKNSVFNPLERWKYDVEALLEHNLSKVKNGEI